MSQPGVCGVAVTGVQDHNAGAVAELVRSLGGVVAVVGPPSGVERAARANFHLANDGTLADLWDCVEAMMLVDPAYYPVNLYI
jgi:hypothetical protein